MDQRPGAYTKIQEATTDTQKICDAVKPQVEKETGEHYKVYNARLYRSQVVDGVNYVIKVHVGGGHYLHLMVYQSLSGEVKFNCLKKVEDLLEPFQC